MRTSTSVPQKKTRRIKASGKLIRNKRKLTLRQKVIRTGIAVVAILVLISIGIAILWNYIFSNLQEPPQTTPYPTSPLTNPAAEHADVINILLLGVDARNPAIENGLSDSMIILTIDTRSNQIKLTSILRDSYTYIYGQNKPQKINAAHSIGGAQLALKTVNDVLRLNITKYVVVNMQNLAQIIDIAGGVTIDLSSGEMRDMNKRLNTNKVEQTGVQLLNGRQAVEYSRIRAIDSDWNRTGRQRDVLTKLYESFRKVGNISKGRMIQKGLPLISTNMTSTEITSLALDVLPSMKNEILEMRLPIEGYYEVNTVGSWHMVVDYNRMIPLVHEFIFGEIFSFDPVPTMIPAFTPTAAPTSIPEPTPIIYISPTPTIKITATPTPIGEVTVSPIPTPTREAIVSPNPTPTKEAIVSPNPTPTNEATPTPTITPVP